MVQRLEMERVSRIFFHFLSRTSKQRNKNDPKGKTEQKTFFLFEDTYEQKPPLENLNPENMDFAVNRRRGGMIDYNKEIDVYCTRVCM